MNHNIYVLGFIFACGVWQVSAESAPEAISALRKDTSSKNLINAGGCLRGLGRFEVKSKEFSEIQSLMLSTPGHATVLANEVERYRSSPANSQDRYDYNRYRYWYLVETLKHLPSPETIQVLGHYLFDERDPVKNWSDVPPPPENSKLACFSLSSIGLRNPPQIDNDARNADPAPWRLWYSKIQSGELAFSFLGQNVEYRFSPHGIVQKVALHKTAGDLAAEIPRPPESTPPEAPAIAPAPSVLAAAPAPPAPWTRFWPGLVGIAGIVTGLIAWRWRKRLRKPV